MKKVSNKIQTKQFERNNYHDDDKNRFSILYQFSFCNLHFPRCMTCKIFRRRICNRRTTGKRTLRRQRSASCSRKWRHRIASSRSTNRKLPINCFQSLRWLEMIGLDLIFRRSLLDNILMPHKLTNNKLLHLFVHNNIRHDCLFREKYLAKARKIL